MDRLVVGLLYVGCFFKLWRFSGKKGSRAWITLVELMNFVSVAVYIFIILGYDTVDEQTV